MDASFRLGLRAKPEDLCFIYSICSPAENPEIKFRAFSTKNCNLVATVLTIFLRID